MTDAAVRSAPPSPLAERFWSIARGQDVDREPVEPVDIVRQVLAILDARAAGGPVAEPLWQALFASEPHVRLKRRLAVKVLAQHLAKDAHALARFNREAEIISQLQHPHVVQVTDFDTTEAGEPYLVMELLAGQSLAALLERERCLAIQDAIRIAYQVSSGLAAAHAANIVHRDLKPANIFLAEVVAGQGAVVKLLDVEHRRMANVLPITAPSATPPQSAQAQMVPQPQIVPPQISLSEFILRKLNDIGPMSKEDLITFAMKDGMFPDVESTERAVHAALISTLRNEQIRQLQDGTFAPVSMAQTVRFRRAI